MYPSILSPVTLAARCPMDVRKVRGEAEARQALAAAQASGLPRRVWARQNGLCPRSLNGWRIALLRRQQLHNGAKLRLVELVPALLPTSRPTSYALQIGDLRLEFDDSFQEQTLRRLLTVLRSC